MAGSVNIWMADWRWTGKNVRTPEAEVDIRLEWTGADGLPREWEGTATFPDDLQLVPVAWVKEELEDLIIRAARKRLGIDDG